MIIIRKERPEDMDAIRTINEQAFEQPAEADIVEKLRERCENTLSLVALLDEQPVGHILFSPVVLETEDGPFEGMGLAPMSVMPACQRQEIGTRLVESGLDRLCEERCPFVIVLGHPEYYPRFGFEPASQYGIKCQWDCVPDEAFMVLILDKEAMQGKAGVARYRSEFDEVM